MKILFVLLFGVFLNAESVTSSTLRLSGATTIQPIIEKIADAYYKETKEPLLVEGGGTESGIEKVVDGRSQIAMVARNLTEEEKSRFAYMTIAIDAVAIIYNKNQNIKNLTKNELIGIYDGSVKKWKDVGCECPNLIVISRKTDRATLNVFEDYSGLKSPKRKNLPPETKLIRSDAWEAESNINTLLWVAGLKGSIAIVSHAEAERYIAMGYPIRISTVDNIYPSNESIKNGTYPIKRELNLLWQIDNPKVEQFAKWIKNDAFQKAVEELGFVAVDR
ncbi:MAG: substrate-binding domain-containing protein [Sulfurimonas sp.]|uniref:PstS family phosphate ABC transporter substrate-binding protein n=1 Tax=Sulfurimonas sp. TaxID=2022749 RepID=UPI002621478E|nr:substrate-binding domain-containing protein [Sulfurimonas sp.]MDD5372014.1 substrate-binding domain-containing protein [Sulfurimonas sp.]